MSVPKKKWTVEIEPHDDKLEEFRPWPGVVASMTQEVRYYTYKLMWGDECVLECKMFVPIEFALSSDGKSVVDFENFLREVQE